MLQHQSLLNEERRLLVGQDFIVRGVQRLLFEAEFNIKGISRAREADRLAFPQVAALCAFNNPAADPSPEAVRTCRVSRSSKIEDNLDRRTVTA